MANALYPLWEQERLKGTANTSLNSGNVYATLVTSAYTYSATHQFRSDVAAGTQVDSAAALASPTFANGQFGASNLTWSAVAAGTTFNAVIIWVNTGVAATSPLVAYIDTIAAGLPALSNGGDLVANWSGTGIFVS
jgi:hypothetical protein